MKILIVTQHFWPENFRINDFAQELVRSGHQVTVLTGLPNYPRGHLYSEYGFIKGPYRETWEGMEILRVPIVTRGSRKGLRLVINYLSFAFLGSLVALFRLRGKYDRTFVHQTSPVFMGIPAVIYKIFKKTPVYFWVLDLWPETLVTLKILKENGLGVSLLRRLVHWIYSHCEAILVPSNRIKDQIVATGIPAEKMVYFPYWAEDVFLQTEFSEKREVVVRSKMPKGFNVTFSGNIGIAQDLETLVAAAHILKNETDIHFVILGDGHSKVQLEAMVKRLNLSKQIHFLGSYPTEDMPIFYKYSDALFVSLVRDPLFAMTVPSKVQAYMAGGKPVIAALEGEGAEIVNLASCGHVVAPGDAQSLAEGILRLKSLSEEERQALGKNGQDYYMDKFHREKTLLRFHNLGTELYEADK